MGMTRMLKKAMVLSILLHLAVFVSFRPPMLLPEQARQLGARVIEAQLLAAGPVVPATPPVDSRAAPAERAALVAAEATRKAGDTRRIPVLPANSRSTATDDVAVTDRSLVVSGQAAPVSAAGETPAEESNLDGVRQYRLSLAREARRFKRYPGLARERGWEGVVVVVVTTVAGVGVPQVKLSQSSGFEPLDQAALELLELAVQSAVLPETLRGRQFALTLPIHFRLDD